MKFFSFLLRKLNFQNAMILIGANIILITGFTNCSDVVFDEINNGQPVSRASVLTTEGCPFNGDIISNGQSTVAYLNSSVPFGQDCIKETRSCANNMLSGSYTFATCGVGAPASCLFNGQTIASGQVVSAFQNSSVSFGQTCVTESRTCTNGVLSGSYSYGSCATDAPASCLFNGQTISSGQSLTAFQNPSAAYGTACANETRTCLNGTLSGSFSYGSCVVSAPASCLFNGQTISSGTSINAYNSSSVLFGQACQPQSRTCVNGALSGNYAFASCAVNAPASCIFNGQTIANGQSVRTYESSSVAFGSSCAFQDRICTNGTLSGTFAFATCAPNAPASCLFGGQTIASGQTVTSYQSPTVPYGSTCASQVNMCINGTIGGTYKSATCSVDPAPVASLTVPLILATALDTQVKLDWPKVAGATHYVLSRSLDNVNYTQISDLTANTYLDTGLTNNTLYYYRLIALDANNNQGYPAVVSVTPVATGQPGFGKTRLLLKWDPVAGATYNLSKYDQTFCPSIEASGLCSTTTSLLQPASTVTSYIDDVYLANTIDGHSYLYTLTITLANGITTTRTFTLDWVSSYVFIDQVATGLQFSVLGTNSSIGTFRDFTVYRDGGAGGNVFTKIGNSTSGYYTDTTVQSGKTYCYSVQLNYDGAGSSAPMGGYGAPSKRCITYVAVTLTGAISGSNLNLSWNPVFGATYQLSRYDQWFCPTTTTGLCSQTTSLLPVGATQTSISNPVVLANTIDGHTYGYTLTVTLSDGKTVTRDFYLDWVSSYAYVEQVSNGFQLSILGAKSSIGTYRDFTVYRDDGHGSNVYTSLGNSVGGYITDTTVQSGNVYCYTFQINYTGAGSSAPMGGYGSPSKRCYPYVDTQLVGTLSGGNLNFTWKPVPGATYQLTRVDQTFCPTTNTTGTCTATSNLLPTGSTQTSLVTPVYTANTIDGHTYSYTLTVTLSNGIVVTREFYLDWMSSYVFINQVSNGYQLSVLGTNSSIGTYKDFTVYRDDGNGGSVFTTIGNSVGGYLTDTNVVSGKTYCYTVQLNYVDSTTSAPLGSSAPMGGYGSPSKRCLTYIPSNLTGAFTN